VGIVEWDDSGLIHVLSTCAYCILYIVCGCAYCVE
jgi:hypothetical protein